MQRFKFYSQDFCCVLKALDDRGTVTEWQEGEEGRGRPDGHLSPLTSCVTSVTQFFEARFPNP